jgi:excinuclease ABC subunit A
MPATDLKNKSSNGRTRVGKERIQIRGARVHNLKNIDLDIPRNQFVVITGPSGSGKSSLAFDTIHAEGQRQYIESLSVYARQFLNQMQRPDVDLIDGLQPTICIDQRPGIQNPRSTVATVTEIYDFLRLLMARLGEPFCYQCEAPISQQTEEQIQDAIISLPKGTRTMIMAPMVRGRRGKQQDIREQIRKAGFVRARVDGQVYDLEDFPELAAGKVHHVDAVVDRVIIRPGLRDRIGESVGLALHYGSGLVSICYFDSEDESVDPPRGEWRDVLYSTLYACPACHISYEEVEPRTFSFNSPYGACPDCDGLGSVLQFDIDMILPDRSLSLPGGAVLAWKGTTAKRLKQYHQECREFLQARDIDWDLPVEKWKSRDREHFIHGDGKKYHGLMTLLEKEYVSTPKQARLDQLDAFRGQLTCRSCQGTRLRKEATSILIGGKNIHQITSLSVLEAEAFFKALEFPPPQRQVADPIVSEILGRLSFLQKVGVHYLSLGRAADTLSGGEMQRVRLAKSIGSGLVGVCYVLDEPSIGLHQRDNYQLIESLRDLQHQGNTVLVVEHDEMMMRAADRLVDIGPGAGKRGGQIVADGSPEDVEQMRESITGRYLSGQCSIPVPARRRRIAKTRSITLSGVTTNNLRNITVQFPTRALVCVTGVSGSGKSSLVNETLLRALQQRLGLVGARPGPHRSLRGASQVDRVVQINQVPIGRTPRSNAATYTGVFDEIRKVFASTREAKQRGYRVSRFSFNVKTGRCAECQGQGARKIEMNFLPDLYVTCDQCHGARFNKATLQVRYRGTTIADVLEMSIDEATGFFENFSTIQRMLKGLQDVGLGYLPLGQPSTTLSGGEAQRIKLATALARGETGKTLYLLDEPTTGLHFDDIRKLLDVLGQLVDRGNTVVVIEHNLDVIKCADWIIDLGPEGGEEGGMVVAVGTPDQVAHVEESWTGKFLRPLLETR